MSEFKLVIVGDANAPERHYSVSADYSVIGRSVDADIVLTGKSVSRRHARVWLKDGVVNVEDLDSRNGVFVNGKQVKRGPIAAGDKLSIGEISFDLLQYDADVSGMPTIGFEDGTTLYEKMMTEGTGRFPILYRATQLLGTVFDIERLMEQILEVIFEALPVRRGYVLTLPKNSREPVVRATLSRDDQAAGPPLSHTLIDHVVKHREAILVMDAQTDERFKMAESVLSHSIRTAMCAPLFGRQGMEGLIYVDSGNVVAPFDENSLELFTVLARVVGVAVENARLYQERVDQERLAALGKAMSDVGHCVKNILTGIRGGAEFIDNAIEKSDLKYLERGWPLMRRAIDRIDMLVLNMLTFARDQELMRVPTNINPMVRQVINAIELRAQRYGITINFEPGLLGEAFVDSHALQRAVLNIVVNAIEACERKGGTVSIVTTADGRGHFIEVRDTGPGIAPEILPKLSTPFVTSKGSGNIGLGLACAFKIVRAHGGDILIESELGKGTKATIELPRETGMITRRPPQ